MRKISTIAICFLPWAGTVWAHHDKTPLREAVIEGHSHAVGGATLWLAGAMVALVLALMAVQKTVFRKRCRMQPGKLRVPGDGRFGKSLL